MIKPKREFSISPSNPNMVTDDPYRMENGVIKNRVEKEEWIPWQSSNPGMKIGLAEFSGLPLVMHNVPVGIAAFSGLPVICTGWEFLATGKATFSGLPLEKWFAYTPSFFIQDENGIILKDLSFESLFAGQKSEVQKLTAINNLETEMNMTLTPGTSLNQLGSDIDTYLSQYSSLNNIDYSNQPLTLTIPSQGELDFFTYWQPPSNAKIGWKQWLYDLDLEGVPSLEGWGYVSWFPVTGTGVAITEPHVPYSLVRVDYVHGLMEHDFKDIRFALENHSILKHYLISKTDGDHAYFLIEFLEIPATPGEVMVYVYSGNTTIEDESDSSLYHLNEYFPLSESSEVFLKKWENNGLSYNLNNGLEFWRGEGEGYIKNILLPIPESFNYQFDLYSGQGAPRNIKGVALFNSNNEKVLFVGYGGLGIWVKHRFESEGEWRNVYSGWVIEEGLMYNPTNGSMNRRDVFNIVKNGNDISVHVNGVHRGDTTITSEVKSIVAYYYNTGVFADTAVLYYISESDLVGIPNPVIGEIDPSWINIYPLPVKADVLYASRDLPGLTPERRFAVRLGDTLYE